MIQGLAQAYWCSNGASGMHICASGMHIGASGTIGASGLHIGASGMHIGASMHTGASGMHTGAPAYIFPRRQERVSKTLFNLRCVFSVYFRYDRI